MTDTNDRDRDVPDTNDEDAKPSTEGASSHDTAGQFPAGEENPRDGEPREGASSNETAGQFPADEVNDDAPATYTTVGPDHTAEGDTRSTTTDEGDK